MGDNLTPADIKAVVGDSNNGTSYIYPVFPYGASSGVGSGIGGYGSDWIWIILLLALFGGFNGNGNGGFGGGFNDDYAWLSNGQKEIMQNTNQGFNTLHLSNQIDTISNGINSLSNQLCNCCADMNQTVSNGFYNAEISANNRQMANMQTSFDLSRQLADCCCENRLGIANLNSTIISENCADRQLINEVGRDIITNQTANTQRILDQLCADKIDAKNEKIADLERQLTMADLKASQIAQTAELRLGQEREVDALYDRLSNCPVPTTPVYGRTPIFTCPNNNSGCGCGSTFGSTLV